MLEVSAEWNQPCRSQSGTPDLFLGVRIRPSGELSDPPVQVLVLLDLSKSMTGVKLDNAKAAVLKVWDLLRPGDRLAMMTFSTRVNPCLDWTEKGRANDDIVRNAVGSCAVEVVTLLDDGLSEAIEVASRAPTGAPRFIWVVTDGDPTDALGHPAEDHRRYLERVAAAADLGLSVGAVGLGDAKHYRHQFLRDLSDRGRGSFCYAPDPETLSAKLEGQLAAAHDVVASQGRMEVSFTGGARLVSAARIVPEYLPIRVSDGVGSWSPETGPLSRPRTVVMLEVVHTVFGAPLGVLDMGEISVSAIAGGSRLEAPPVPVRIEVAPSSSRKIYDRNQEIEALRWKWLLNRAAAMRADTGDPAEKLRATEDLARLSRETGDLEEAVRYAAEADLLRQGGDLSPDQLARAEDSARRSGPIALSRRT